MLTSAERCMSKHLLYSVYTPTTSMDRNVHLALCFVSSHLIYFQLYCPLPFTILTLLVSSNKSCFLRQYLMLLPATNKYQRSSWYSRKKAGKREFLTSGTQELCDHTDWDWIVVISFCAICSRSDLPQHLLVLLIHWCISYDITRWQHWCARNLRDRESLSYYKALVLRNVLLKK